MLNPAEEFLVNRGYVHTGQCVYRPDELWALRMHPAPRVDQAYQDLLDDHHRRSGWVVYKPVCQSCHACMAIRVPVEGFRPTKSQRKALRRNEDVHVELGPPSPSEEKLELHNRFVEHRFERGESSFRSLDTYEEVFGASPITTQEMRYRIDGRLVGLGLVDVLPNVISSVYFYFDPGEQRRSLGTFSALKEIELARESGRNFLYLGYYITDCREMNYKARFQPCELLHPDGEWRPFDPPPRQLPTTE
jgi:arginyl-tRNA--protein-N-Asp/Glu arginylyltransferase